MNCSLLVKPVDVSPIRSPQALHTALLPLFKNKDLVEIGTRNGDGMECFAHVTKSAKAIEYHDSYCQKLRIRNATLFSHTGKHFSVVCKDYRLAGALDADYILWWHERPQLVDPTMLVHVSNEARQGRLRRGARVVVLSDQQSREDEPSWRLLKDMSEKRFLIPFNEHDACTRQLKGKRATLCQRARGTFGASVIRAGHINRTTLKQLVDARRTVLHGNDKPWFKFLWG